MAHNGCAPGAAACQPASKPASNANRYLRIVTAEGKCIANYVRVMNPVNQRVADVHSNNHPARPICLNDQSNIQRKPVVEPHAPLWDDARTVGSVGMEIDKTGPQLTEYAESFTALAGLHTKDCLCLARKWSPAGIEIELTLKGERIGHVPRESRSSGSLRAVGSSYELP